MKGRLLCVLLIAFSSTRSFGQVELWGACTTCGEDNIGSIYRLVNGTYEQVKEFKRDHISLGGITGEMLPATDGKLYGLTTCLGSYGEAVIVSYDPNTVSFEEHALLPPSIGSDPGGNLIEYSPGLFLGVCRAGGDLDDGTIYSFDMATGSFEKLVDLNCSQNCLTADGLTAHPDGLLYGTLGRGGEQNSGGVFSFEPSTNTLTLLSSFPNTFPTGALSRLTVGGDGNLYGLRAVLQAPGGVLYSFDPVSNEIEVSVEFNADANEWPAYYLTAGPDGQLYGVTQTSNSYINEDHGSVFRFDPLTAIYGTVKRFTYDFGTPLCAPAFHGDGTLSVHTGMVTSTPQWTIQPAFLVIEPSNGNVLFSGSSGLPGGTQLSMSFDGLLYSMVPAAFQPGTIKRFGTTGLLGPIFPLNKASNGSGPSTYLIRSSDDKIVGVTAGGGRYGRGVLFNLDPFTLTYDTLISIPDIGYIRHNELLELEPGAFLFSIFNSGGGSLMSYDTFENTITELCSFDTLGIRGPASSFVLHDGWIYGTSVGSTVYNEGTLWRYHPDLDQVDLLHTFTTPDYIEPRLHADLNVLPDGRILGAIRNEDPYNAGSYLFQYDPSTDQFNLLPQVLGVAAQHYAAGFAGAGDGARWSTTIRNLSSPAGAAMIRFDPMSNSVQQIQTFEGEYPKGRSTIGPDGRIYQILAPASTTSPINSTRLVAWDPLTQTLETIHSFTGSGNAQQGHVGGLLSTSLGVGVDDRTEDLKLRLHPNPVNDLLQVRMDDTWNGPWELRDAFGRTVHLGRMDSGLSIIDVTKLDAGCYVLTLINDQGLRVSAQVVVCH